MRLARGTRFNSLGLPGLSAHVCACVCVHAHVLQRANKRRGVVYICSNTDSKLINHCCRSSTVRLSLSLLLSNCTLCSLCQRGGGGTGAPERWRALLGRKKAADEQQNREQRERRRYKRGSGRKRKYVFVSFLWQHVSVCSLLACVWSLTSSTRACVRACVRVHVCVLMLSRCAATAGCKIQLS